MAAADASVLFYNADGAESESCGNATRCVARLLMDERGLARVRISTAGGLLACADAGKGLVTLDMGMPRLDWQQIPMASAVDTQNFPLDVGGATLPASAVSVGNPHCVLFVPDAEKAPVAALGAVLVGVAEQFGLAYAPTYGVVFTFVIMTLVLAFRPHGILGRRA